MREDKLHYLSFIEIENKQMDNTLTQTYFLKQYDWVEQKPVKAQ